MSALLLAQDLSKAFIAHKREGLFKTTKIQVPALSNFNLEISKPTIFGLVGPNGAGKTTFIKHCLGLVKNTGGKLEVLGFDPYKRSSAFLKQVGLVSGQKQNLDSNLSALESLKLSGYLYDMTTDQIDSRINTLVSSFNLEDKIDIPVRQLSLRQRMKFEIISSILHSPRFLFMDEPTLGLDFEAQTTMRSLLLDLHRTQELTILLTSHYLPDITTLCQRLAVIEKGQKVYEGTVDELMNKTSEEGYLQTLVTELSNQSNKS